MKVKYISDYQNLEKKSPLANLDKEGLKEFFP